MKKFLLTGAVSHSRFYPEPKNHAFPPVSEVVLWYGMFALCGRLLGTMGFARGAPSER